MSPNLKRLKIEWSLKGHVSGDIAIEYRINCNAVENASQMFQQIYRGCDALDPVITWKDQG